MLKHLKRFLWVSLTYTVYLQSCKHKSKLHYTNVNEKLFLRTAHSCLIVHLIYCLPFSVLYFSHLVTIGKLEKHLAPCQV